MDMLRNLTTDEIDEILELIPGPISLMKDNIDIIRNSLKNSIREQLIKVKIHPDGVEEFKKEFRYHHENSFLHPGTSLGNSLAEGIGEVISQMMLNAIHSIGADKKPGSDEITELLNASQNRKNEEIQIVFKKNYTKEEALKIVKKLEMVSLDTLVVSSSEIMTEIPQDDKWWYENLYSLGMEKIDNIFLRLKVNTNKLYLYNLSLVDIVKKIKEEQEVEFEYYPSPSYIGIIDVYYNYKSMAILQKSYPHINLDSKTMFKGVMVNDFIFQSLQTTFKTVMKNITISGVSGVTNVKVKNKRLTELFSSIEYEHPTPIEDEYLAKNTWKVNLKYKEAKHKGVKLERILSMFNSFPEYFKIHKKDGEIRDQKKNPYIIITILQEGLNKINEKDENKSNPKNPNTLINSLIRETLVERRAFVKANMEKHKEIIIPEPNKVYRKCFYLEVTTNGNNFNEIVNYSFVDRRYTFPKNVNLINNFFGIDAAWSFLVNEYFYIFHSNDKSVNSSNLMLLSSIQTSKGIIIPVSSKGTAKTNNTTLTKASFDNPIGNISSAAFMGKEEPVLSGSSLAIIGKRLNLGTGYFKIRSDLQKLGAKKELKVSKDAVVADISDDDDEIEATIDAPDFIDQFFKEDEEEYVDSDEENLDFIGDEEEEGEIN